VGRVRGGGRREEEEVGVGEEVGEKVGEKGV
jgi:hypothetical protein